jgi:uncharacterized protein YaiE (UPF0345 family)
VLQVNDGDGATLKLTDPATGANRGLGITLQGTSAAISNCESGELRFGTGNTERMRIASGGITTVGGTTGAGRLNAIASNWSENALAVYSANVAAQTNFAGIAFFNQDADSATGNVADIYTDPTGTLSLTSAANPAIQLKYGSGGISGGTAALTVDSSGNVGIGTTSPSVGGAYSANNTLTIFGGTNSGSEDTAYLEIGSSTNVNGYQTGGIAFYNDDNSGAGATTRKQTAIIRALSVTSDSNAGDDSGGILQFLTKSEAGSVAESLRINSDGAVVINNIGGDAQLYLGGSSGTSRMYVARTGLDAFLWNVSNGNLRFGTNDTERMRIDSSGNLRVGTTSNLHLLMDVELL